MSDRISPEIRKLIREHITSVDQLEVLLLLHRTAGREWTAREVADELRTNVQMAGERLSDLSYRGLLVMTDTARFSYVYRPTDIAIARAVDDLAAVYPTFRHRVIELIFSRPEESILSFADAFRITPKKKD